MKKEKETISSKDSLIVVWRLFLLTWQKNRIMFSGSIMLAILPTIFGYVNMYIYALITDAVVKSVTHHVFHPDVFYPLIIGRLISLVITSLCNSMYNYTESIIWLKMPNVIHEMYVKNVSRLDQETLENSEFRNLMEKASMIGARPQSLIENFINALASAISVIIALTILAKANGIVALIVIITALPSVVKQMQYSKISYGIWTGSIALRKRAGYLSKILTDYQFIKELKLYSLREKFIHDLEKLYDGFFQESKQANKKAFTTGGFIDFIGAWVAWGVDVYFFFQAIMGKITIGSIAFYANSVSSFRSSLNGLLRNIVNIYEQSHYVKCVFDAIDAKPLIIDAQDAREIILHGVAPRIEFRDISFAYPKSKQKILFHFSLIIESGQKVALVGENGAGKTTLINLLARIYEPTSGDILINDIPLNKIQTSSWRKTLGVLFQGFTSFEYSITDNIHFGNVERDSDQESILKAARFSGVDEIAAKLEHGYDQMIGKTFENGVELSGGQKQRVALARSFFKDAEILVLDEPTAAIDAKAEAEIFDKVQKLSKNKTVIIISHRFSTVRHADIIYVLDKGKILESGNHDQLMKKKGKYAELFTLQAKGYQ